MRWHQRLFRRARAESQLDAELRFHLDQQIADDLATGMSPEEARRRAWPEFGGLDQVKEERRDVGAARCVETVIQDVRYGLRQLRRNPGFTTIAVITLALGIGANTAIFSLINAVMLRNLPVENPQALALFADNPSESISMNRSMNRASPGEPVSVNSGQWKQFSYPLYQDLRDQNRAFRGICAFETGEDTLTIRLEEQGQSGAAQVAQGKLVSGNFFSVLGVKAVVGRTLTPKDDRLSAAPVAVASYRYWQNKLGADPSVVGRAMDIDGVPITLVGITPPGFFGVRIKAHSEDFWIPLSLRSRIPLTVMPQAKSLLTDPDTYWLNLMGRLKPGISMRQANAEVNLHLRNYLTALVGSKMTASVRREIGHAYVSLAPGGRGLSQMRSLYSEPLYILLVIVALVLLIACANVANLLLSRATSRKKEMAMRLALGAARARLVRQLLVEGVLLAIAGGIVGAMLAAWGVRVLASLVAANAPLNVNPDLAVFGFTIAVSLFTVVLSSLAPALRTARVELVPALKGSFESSARRRHGLGKGLVVFQIAVSLVLLIAAGLLIHSLINLESQNVGFSPEHVLLVDVNPELAGYKFEQLPDLYRELVRRISALPGVRSASVGGTSPMSGSAMSADVSAAGGQRSRVGDVAQFVPVAPQYFSTEGMRILRGRALSLRDTISSAPVAVVNQSFVRRFLPGVDPIGRRFSFGSSFEAPGFEIVGVVQNAKYAGAGESTPPMFFLSAYEIPAGPMEAMLGVVNEIEVRAVGNPTAVTAEVRKAIQEIDQNLPVTDVITLTKQVSDSLGQPRAISELTSFFGLLGLVLACIGLYGIMAYNVSRRTNEIGIRMALGAQKVEILWMVLRQSLLLIVIGIAVAVPVALASARLMVSLLYGVRPADPLSIVLAALVITAVGLLAGYLPARQAANVDPMVSLRHE
jgi:predicted permease